MKKSVMYSETRTWFFELDMAEGADLDEVMSVLKGTDGFYRYVDDGTSNGIGGEWSEVPEEWRGEDDPDYTEEFRELAEMELDGKERHAAFSSKRRAIEVAGKSCDHSSKVILVEWTYCRPLSVQQLFPVRTDPVVYESSSVYAIS